MKNDYKEQCREVNKSQQKSTEINDAHQRLETTIVTTAMIEPKGFLEESTQIEASNMDSIRRDSGRGIGI